MTTLDTDVPTCLGELHVRRTGTGPPAVLWHSLWVDSRSWGPLADALATRFPQRYRTPTQALDEVARLSQKYG